MRGCPPPIHATHHTMISYHRKPLPDTLVAFGSPQGRAMLTSAMATGDASAFFPLVSHLHSMGAKVCLPRAKA